MFVLVMHSSERVAVICVNFHILQVTQWGTMLAPEVGSTNSTNHGPSFGEPRSEKSPLIHQRRLFHSFQGMFETPNQGKTLGTFAGVFSPVALSMFSALMFLRVGKINKLFLKICIIF